MVNATCKVGNMIAKAALPFVVTLVFCSSGVSADGIDRWNGFYLGGALSYSDASSAVSGNRFTYNQNQAVNLGEHDLEGAGVGGFAGWNYRRGNWVYGSELAMSWDRMESNLVFNTDNDIDQVKIKWLGTLAGRFGYVSGETLFFIKSGLAFAQINSLGGDVNGGTLSCPMRTLEMTYSLAPLLLLAWSDSLPTHGLLASNLAIPILVAIRSQTKMALRVHKFTRLITG